MSYTLRAALAALLLVTAAPARANDGRVSADYAVSFIGIPIGTGTMVSTTDGTNYRTTLTARVTGIAALFAGGSGTAVATGRVTSAGVAPGTFNAEIRTRGKVEAVEIGMAGGQVRSVTRTPNNPLPPNLSPVTEEHLRGVLDPLSSGIFLARGDGPVTGEAACDRHARIFNGRERFDLIYSFVATRQVEIAGYKGPAAICKVRFEPIAGYRMDRPDLEQARRRSAEVTLVPIVGTRTLLPARIAVATGFGSGLAEATRLDLDAGVAVARRAASN